jgi:hypothetical protein
MFNSFLTSTTYACTQNSASNAQCQADAAAYTALNPSLTGTAQFNVNLPCSVVDNGNKGVLCTGNLISLASSFQEELCVVGSRCIQALDNGNFLESTANICDALGGTPFASGVCCADGTRQAYAGTSDPQVTCASNGGASQDPPVSLTELMTTEPVSTSPAVPIDDAVAEYAKTLCRVLNDCGDADEPLCASPEQMSGEQYEECVVLGCCSYTGILTLRKRSLELAAIDD